MDRLNRTRRDERYEFWEFQDARLEFNYPHPDGAKRVCMLHDLSVAGISFLLEEELPLLARGARLEDVRVQIGPCEIHGSLLVQRVTDYSDKIFCGGVFYPAAEADMLKLNGVIAGLGARAEPAVLA